MQDQKEQCDQNFFLPSSGLELVNTRVLGENLLPKHLLSAASRFPVQSGGVGGGSSCFVPTMIDMCCWHSKGELVEAPVVLYLP